MSAGKKHSRSDGDDARRVKKAKIANGDAPAAGDEVAAKPKKDKKQRDEKRAKKEAKSSKSKTEEPAQESDAEMTEAVEVVVEGAVETAAPDATAESDSEPKAAKKEKKEKKEKKDKKEKKEKKDKKSKKLKTSDESAPESVPEKDNASVAATSAAPAVHRNGATYRYTQAAALDALSDAEIKTFLDEKEINISEPAATGLRPILNFSQIPASKLLSKKPFATFTTPTPIQSASWPFALSGRDVIGIAETGSGKTLAFSLPCIEALNSSPKPKSTRGARARAVIVSPTRELAMQTHAAISVLAELVGLSAVCLYGGASKDEQRALLRRNSGADIIVATPGRLKDFLSEGDVSLADVMFAVLDEADRMLDKGFEEDIKQILGACPAREKRQTLMFTATWPTSVRGLAESFMVDPIKVTIGKRTFGGGDDNGSGSGTIELQANSRIEQKVEVVDPRGKEQRLLELLRDAQKGSAKNDRILVFCLYKKEATRVEQFLERRGIPVVSIHGDLRQDQRTRSLEAFKSGTTSVLVATDVAARGLDIPEVKLVINLTVRFLCA